MFPLHHGLARSVAAHGDVSGARLPLVIYYFSPSRNRKARMEPRDDEPRAQPEMRIARRRALCGPAVTLGRGGWGGACSGLTRRLFEEAHRHPA